MFLGKSMMSIPFKMMLYVFIGSDAEKGGLKYGTEGLSNRVGRQGRGFSGNIWSGDCRVSRRSEFTIECSTILEETGRQAICCAIKYWMTFAVGEPKGKPNTDKRYVS